MTKLAALLLAANMVLSPAPMQFGAWLTYWDADRAVSEMNAVNGFDDVICFEAFFEENGNCYMPEDSVSLLSDMRDVHSDVFLSIVNDVQMESGEIVQKSKNFLRDNLLTETDRDRHINRILQLVDAYELSGIEIDYENMKNDESLWGAFTVFIEKLYDILSRDGIRMRVVMECEAPRYAAFPEGPEYICMCYNLYGTHSGPGPKADLNFLKEVGEQWKSVPGKVRMAFATGGFLWESDHAVRSFTEQEAAEFLADNNIEPRRDKRSMALKAVVSQSPSQIVWYADGITLSSWRDTLAEMGYHGFDLFRLGGNTEESLSKFINK